MVCRRIVPKTVQIYSIFKKVAYKYNFVHHFFDVYKK